MTFLASLVVLSSNGRNPGSTESSEITSMISSSVSSSRQLLELSTELLCNFCRCGVKNTWRVMNVAMVNNPSKRCNPNDLCCVIDVVFGWFVA